MARLVIGVGSWERSDDGAGLAVAERLDHSACCRVLEHSGEAASLMGVWEDEGDVVIVDAMSSGRPAGSIVEYDVISEPLPRGVCYSTHAFGVETAVEMARALGELPPALRVIGIEGGDFGFGRGMSPEVEAAVDQVVDLLNHA